MLWSALTFWCVCVCFMTITVYSARRSVKDVKLFICCGLSFSFPPSGFTQGLSLSPCLKSWEQSIEFGTNSVTHSLPFKTFTTGKRGDSLVRNDHVPQGCIRVDILVMRSTTRKISIAQLFCNYNFLPLLDDGCRAGCEDIPFPFGVFI